ncbi:MAG: XRE family transcriptional regulator [Akkermansiaceae bacterium]|nr:XRE family transcriptional regulator [Akkermansiaceae bacterium]
MDLLRIAQLVRQTRKQQGMTVEALADKSGFSKTYVSRLENFRITPSIKSLSKIADALGIQMSTFFETSSEPTQYMTGHLDEGEEIERNGGKYGIKYHALAFNKPERKLNPFVVEYHRSDEKRGFLAHDSEEFFVLLEGELEFLVYDDENCTLMSSGQTFYLSDGVPHRVQLAEGCDYAKALIVYSKEDAKVES